MYNPFDDVVMRTVLSKLEDTLRTPDRPSGTAIMMISGSANERNCAINASQHDYFKDKASELIEKIQIKNRLDATKKEPRR